MAQLTKDEQIKLLADKVQAKRAEIAKVQRPSYKTNMTFKFDEGSSNVVAVNVESDLKKLVSMYAFITDKENAFNAAAHALGIDEKFVWCNSSADDWRHDFSARVKLLQVKKQVEELNQMEKLLEKHKSPEAKEREEFDALMDSINKL